MKASHALRNQLSHAGRRRLNPILKSINNRFSTARTTAPQDGAGTALSRIKTMTRATSVNTSPEVKSLNDTIELARAHEVSADVARDPTSGAHQQGQRATVTLQMKVGNRTRQLVAKVGATLLDVARANHVSVDGTCNGGLACSICHCVMDEKSFRASMAGEIGAQGKTGSMSPTEEDLLMSSFDLQSTSRLSCQVKVIAELDGMEIRYPGMVNNDGLMREPLGMAEARATGAEQIKHKPFKNLTKSAIRHIFEYHAADNPKLRDQMEEYLSLAEVLPFRTNTYVTEELINWKQVPDDPIFQLTFPQPDMLPKDWIADVHKLRMEGASRAQVKAAADVVRAKMNPHPAKQREMNVPSSLDAWNNKNKLLGSGKSQEDPSLPPEVEFERGIQHKYRETVLFFPSEAQYCHSYCTYCFHWSQFVGASNMQFASNDTERLLSYLRSNTGVTDLLITGGDPMVLNSKQLGKYLYSVASDPTLDHVQTIRIGSKSLAYWPYKYVTDDNANEILALLRRVCDSGKHVSLMAHFSHPVELSTQVVQEAIRRLRSTGIEIRCQAPLINNINADPKIWSTMWNEQVRQGMIPYYMFVERDTGARHYFSVPLYKAHQIYSEAIQNTSGLARTARGPSMSCIPGKVSVVGVEEIADEKVFVLKFLQARNPEWQSRVFFAEYDEKAIWMDELKPAFGTERFFFEDEHDEMETLALEGAGSSGQIFQPDQNVSKTN